ncbi:MAG: peptidase M23 [Deltaproteobacteria bacterium]|nr:peptidase M23 [Deltaproteobacteria bacterium]
MPPSGRTFLHTSFGLWAGAMVLLWCSVATGRDLPLPMVRTGNLGVVSDLEASSVPASNLSTEASGHPDGYDPGASSALPVRSAGLRLNGLNGTQPLTVVTKGMLDSGESLSIALQSQGIHPSKIHLVASQLSRVFNFRHARPGHRYRLAQDPDGQVLSFRYSVSPEKSYLLVWDGERYAVSTESAELRAKLAKISGQVDSSLYEAISRLGERAQLANDFADIFAWDIDFSRNVRPGDDFQVLFERLYRTDEDGLEVYVKPGRILAARYRGGIGEYSAIFFEPEESSRGGYYRPDGTAIERAFLMAPLEFNRISSSFSKARRHPILKVVRPHRGIDYAAPSGTPVWSVASGEVIYRDRAGASGNLVKVKHSNGYVSFYAHLSRFESGLKVGDRVSQKQVIGYVGQTGLATGPHVCFRVQKKGSYVNPLDITSPAGDPIARTDWTAFSSQRDQLMSHLGIINLLAAEEAL